MIKIREANNNTMLKKSPAKKPAVKDAKKAKLSEKIPSKKMRAIKRAAPVLVEGLETKADIAAGTPPADQKLAAKPSAEKEEVPATPSATRESAAKSPAKKEVVPVAPKTPPVFKPRPEKYYEAVGRRKRACARVRLYTSNPQNSAEAGNIEVNAKPYKTYFPGERVWTIAEDPLKKLKSMNRFRVTVRVEGGGTHAQAEAVRMGIARTLTLFDANFRKRLKRAGFLKRDPREKERKKYGLKKARRAPQWAKR